MPVRISIAMATYNGAKHIQEQLDSIAKQVCLPYELVVCDDGSTDSTVEIVRKFASTVCFPVHLYQNEQNLGFANNFIKCASLCKGDWIAFSDQDDVWLPEKLSRVSHLIDADQSKKLVLVCHSADLVNEDLLPTGRRIPDVLRDQVIEKNGHYGFLCIAGFTMTFKAELLSGIDSSLRPRDYFAPTDKWQSHDKWIAMLANALGDVAYISESLALYRRHSSALSGPYNRQTATDRIRKSSLVGAEYYQFQANAAKDSAESFRKISALVADGEKKKYLLIGACKFDALAEICGFRARLYALKTPLSKLRILLSILIKKGYWGNHFYSLGTLSFLKDLAFSIGVLAT